MGGKRPGWPEFAFPTKSGARVRIVAIETSSALLGAKEDMVVECQVAEWKKDPPEFGFYDQIFEVVYCNHCLSELSRSEVTSVLPLFRHPCSLLICYMHPQLSDKRICAPFNLTPLSVYFYIA